MMQKETKKAIEKELTLKEIRSFLKTLDLIIKKSLSIPSIREYAQDNAKIKE